MNTGRLGVFLRQYRAAVRTVVLAVAALWYLSIDHPTGNTALWFVVGVVVILLITELLAAHRRPTHRATELADRRREHALRDDWLCERGRPAAFRAA